MSTRGWLTREVIAPSSKGAVLATVLGTLIVVLLVNLVALLYLDRHTANLGYWLVEKKWEILQNLQGPVDWLVLGDSSGNQGIVPAEMTRALGGEAVNLCTIGGVSAIEDTWLLETYLERFPPPRGVLIIHSYDTWCRESEPVFLAHIPLTWGFWNRLTPPLALNAAATRDVFLARYVPLYAESETLSYLIGQGLLSPRKLFRERYHVQPDGYQRFERARPAEVRRDADNHLIFVSGATFALSAENAAALDHLAALAAQHDLDVFLASGPLYEDLFENEAFRRYHGQVGDSLQRAASQHLGLHYLPAVYTFDAGRMASADHVVDAAARTYTRAVAAEIARISLSE